MKKTFYCVKCHVVYEEDDFVAGDEVICDECGGELVERDKHSEFDEGGES